MKKAVVVVYESLPGLPETRNVLVREIISEP